MSAGSGKTPDPVCLREDAHLKLQKRNGIG